MLAASGSAIAASVAAAAALVAAGSRRSAASATPKRRCRAPNPLACGRPRRCAPSGRRRCVEASTPSDERKSPDFSLQAAVAKPHTLKMNVVDRTQHLLARQQAHGAVLGHEVPSDFFPCAAASMQARREKAVNGGCPKPTSPAHFEALGKRGVSATRQRRPRPPASHKKPAPPRNLCRIAPKRPKTGRIVGRTMAHSVLGAGNLGLR